MENCKARPLEAGLRPTGAAETAHSRHCPLCIRRKLLSDLSYSSILLALAYYTVGGGAAVFPHVVTLYNVVTEEDPSTFEETTVNHITILRGVLLDAVKAKNVNESGLVGADAVNLYIPIDVEAADGVTGEPKQYKGPIEFWRAEDKTGLWTLSTGENTFFVKGEAVHPDWSAQKIDAAYDNVYNVNTVDFKDFGGDMSHWEVGGN